MESAAAPKPACERIDPRAAAKVPEVQELQGVLNAYFESHLGRVHKLTRDSWNDKLTKYLEDAKIPRSEDQGATVAARRGARARCCAPRNLRFRRAAPRAFSSENNALEHDDEGARRQTRERPGARGREHPRLGRVQGAGRRASSRSILIKEGR